MVNHSNLSTNPIGNSSKIAPPTCHNQSPLLLKKRALRDVHNEKNTSFTHNRPVHSFLNTQGQVINGIKVFGTNILNPEYPFSPPKNQTSRSNNTDVLSIDLELGKRRYRDVTAEENVDCVNPKRYLQKQPINLPEQPRTCGPELALVSTPSLITSPEDNVEQRMEHRFLRLQKVLKQCDESDQMDYIQMLRCLSPAELSRHAVELEKRSMQLSVEEAREIQRTNALDILGASSSKH